MRLFIESVMIFFGTLMAAGLVALGHPSTVEPGIARNETAQAPQMLTFIQDWIEQDTFMSHLGR